MFGSLGTTEILIILAIALIVFGPKKLPEIGKSLGQAMRELKRTSRDIMDSIERDDDEPEPRPAWSETHASSQPQDQVTHTATESTPEPAPDEKKESVHNAADSSSGDN